MNDECRMQNEVTERKPRRMWLLFLISAFCILTSAFPALAAPTQEEVFKSISSNVDNTIDSRKMFAFFVAAAGAVVMILVINNRIINKERPAPRKRVNHQSKLLRELMKSAGLKSAQIRQLKLLSADLAEKDQPVENLVTLLLCPSLIKKARASEDRPVSRALKESPRRENFRHRF